MGVRHFTLRPAAGKESRTPDSLYSPRRPAPRHSGQSSAKDEVASRITNQGDVEAGSRIVDLWYRTLGKNKGHECTRIHTNKPDSAVEDLVAAISRRGAMTCN